MHKVAVATEDARGLDGVVASRFGRAPYFTIVEVDDSGRPVRAKVVQNPGAVASGGAAIKAIQVLVNEGVEAVVGPNFGPNARAVLAEMGIKMVTMPPGTPVRRAVEEAVRALGA